MRNDIHWAVEAALVGTLLMSEMSVWLLKTPDTGTLKAEQPWRPVLRPGAEVHHWEEEVHFTVLMKVMCCPWGEGDDTGAAAAANDNCKLTEGVEETRWPNSEWRNWSSDYYRCCSCCCCCCWRCSCCFCRCWCCWCCWLWWSWWWASSPRCSETGASAGASLSTALPCTRPLSWVSCRHSAHKMMPSVGALWCCGGGAAAVGAGGGVCCCAMPLSSPSPPPVLLVMVVMMLTRAQSNSNTHCHWEH